LIFSKLEELLIILIMNVFAHFFVAMYKLLLILLVRFAGDISSGVSQLNQSVVWHGLRRICSWMQSRSLSVLLRTLGIHSRYSFIVLI